MKTIRKTAMATILIASLYIVACEAKQIKSVIINSEPQGAEILIDGEQVGQTPMKRDLVFKDKKNGRYLILINKKGFEPQQRYFYYRDDPNILFQLNPQ